MSFDDLETDEICVCRPYLAFFFVGVVEVKIRPPAKLFKRRNVSQLMLNEALHLPCSHVIAACSSFHYDYTTLIPDVFKNENVYVIYNKTFKIVHDKSYWPPYEGPKLFHNPNMQRLKKGRPNSTRIRTEMDEEVEERIPTPRLCGLCRHAGHIRRNCPTNPKR